MTHPSASRSASREFWIVVLSTYGLHLLASIVSLYLHGFRTRVLMNDARVLPLIASELVLAVGLGLYLSRRGWRFSDFRFQFSGTQTLSGLGLSVIALLFYWAVALVAFQVPFVRESVSRMSFQQSVTFPVALLLTAVNPVFEEFLNLGYVQPRLAHYGPGFAISVAVLLRLLTHAYQGVVAVLCIIPIGVVFSWYFWTRQSLYPVVFAHALMDFLALSRHTG